ncbi:VC0807 family protein [Nocardioides hwasunensis]|uniref:DUF3159 domain-containing protein n=1 Tax=Nocardioides hwasunensis TaxID=397258 RepID=A0ABR8MGY7_9ACTN|nr:VC0807 family protein [Nocardioides hwasunensis]MBD3915339.1 hypothetical protein [Nocardioides hwasunensis]
MSLLRPVIGIAGSTGLYYLLRHLGVSVYAALVVGAVVWLLPACVSLLRGQRPGGLEAFFTVLLFASFAVALLPGDERFLLAKDAVVTGGVGFWFLASLRWSDRPLAYQFAKPMVEGRGAWVGDWERRWREDAWFRRMWKTSSVWWAAGTLLDAVARVVLAYTLPADVVPGLNLAMYVVTLVVVNVVTTVVYVRAGAIRGRRRVGS